MSASEAYRMGSIGILMLKTRFPRLDGDIGNPSSFRGPVRYAVVEAARADRIVAASAPSADLLEAFVTVGKTLVDGGVGCLATSCGFMAIVQPALQRRFDVPVIASSLCQAAMLQAMLPPGRRLGVLTIDKRALMPAHLEAAGAPGDLPIEGVEAGRELFRVVMGDLPDLDEKTAARDVIEAGERLRARVPDLGGIVLECTNMGPYARALASHLRLPVFDLVGHLRYWQAALFSPAAQSEA